jgi:outer membrane protein OmpA-like peptidoglycan-associated protein
MRHHLVPITIATLALVACGGGQRVRSPALSAKADTTPRAAAAPADAGVSDEAKTFVLGRSETARTAHGVKPSKIKPTRTEAALKFIVLDKDKGPVQGVVIFAAAPDGTRYYTEETDAEGYAEVLVPVGQTYDLTYLSLGRRDIAATVPVTSAPKQNIKLTLRYKRWLPPPPAGAPPDGPAAAPAVPRFVLSGVTFDTGKATIRAESFPRLDSVVEYMTHKKSSRIEISGHTDNVGNPRINKALSEKRAQACRDYLVSKGIDGSRIEAIGHGDERPIAPNDTDEGRQRNRRIEATEL